MYSCGGSFSALVLGVSILADVVFSPGVSMYFQVNLEQPEERMLGQK